MTTVALFKQDGTKNGEIELNESIFGIEPNENVVYDAIIMQRASLRQGTHAVKNRSAVRGGGRKPWAQKGTGRARQGSIRSVQWVGGGNYGTPVPRDYSKKQNRKERRLALKSALTYKAIDKEIFVVENFDVKSNKTKDFIKTLETLKLEGKTLIVVKELTDNLILGSRNLRDIKVIETHEINTFDVINYKNLVITEEAVKMLEEVLK